MKKVQNLVSQCYQLEENNNVEYSLSNLKIKSKDSRNSALSDALMFTFHMLVFADTFTDPADKILPALYVGIIDVTGSET